MRKIIAINILLLLLGCSNIRENRIDEPLIYTDTSSIQQYNTIKTESEDSLDIIINSRQTQPFNDFIFAGLKLGCSKNEYTRIISKYKKEFDSSIYIINNDSIVKTIDISHISPEFYGGKLYKLDIYIDGDYAYDYLQNLLENKYGLTKYDYFDGYIWKYLNAEISIKTEQNRLCHRTNNSSALYYKGYNGGYTKVSSYIHIKYLDLNLMSIILRKKQIEDSLNQVNELRIIQERMVKAKKQKDLI